ERLGPHRRGPEQQVALPGGFAEVDVLDLGQGLRRVRDLRGRAPAKLQQRRVVGKVDEVAGRGAATLAPEAAHAPRHVGGEADAGLFAVVADVDTRVELLADDRADGRADLARQLGRADGLAAPGDGPDDLPGRPRRRHDEAPRQGLARLRVPDAAVVHLADLALDEARTDERDRDTVRDQLVAERLGERADGELAHRVGAPARDGD